MPLATPDAPLAGNNLSECLRDGMMLQAMLPLRFSDEVWKSYSSTIKEMVTSEAAFHTFDCLSNCSTLRVEIFSPSVLLTEAL